MKKRSWFIPALALLLPAVHACVKTEKKAGAQANIVFASIDGGQTWQDISDGLPASLQKDSIRGASFSATDSGLFLHVGKALYQREPGATASLWTQATSPDASTNIAGSKPGITTNPSWIVNLKKTNGTSIWSPLFSNEVEPRVRTVFETSGGAILLGTNEGIFKTTDDGKTWKLVYAGGLAGNLAEANGVLVGTVMRKIIRSEDGGESWTVANSEDAMAFDQKPIEGGFAAITAVSETGPRRLSTSYDGGKTWESVHSPLTDKNVLDSIGKHWNERPYLQGWSVPVMQLGEALYCTHPKGIFKSADKGKTWKLLLPSVKKKVFSLSASGNVIYAVATRGGC